MASGCPMRQQRYETIQMTVMYSNKGTTAQVYWLQIPQAELRT